MQFLIHPQVFADGDSQSPVAASAAQRDLPGAMAWPEVTRLIKNVVTG